MPTTPIDIIESAITDLYMNMCDNWGAADILSDYERFNGMAMLFQIRMDCDNYGRSKQDENIKKQEWEKSEHTVVYIIINCNRRVFAVVSPDPIYQRIPLEEWKNTSNHSSAWRTDGLQIIHKTYQELYEKCYGMMPDEDRPSIQDANIYVDMAWVESFVQFVRISFEDIDPINGNGQKKLTSINPVKFNISFEV